jgi:nucleoside-diphosphate-sugar epimerase
VPLVLVLGANGFIGSHVVAAMSRLPDMEVVGAGLGTPLAGLEGRWLDVDLLTDDDARLVTELRAARPAVVVNCTGASVGATADLVRLNVLVTDRVVEALARSGLGTRLVHFGSAAEYGPGPVGQPVSESACARPVSPYGIAKLAATQIVLAASDRGREAIVLRVFNALGPSMPPSSLPGAALRRLEEAVSTASSRIELGPLGSVRDFVDVRDIGAAVVAACRVPILDAPLVNVASGTGHAARELVAELARAMGFGGEIAEGAAGSPRSSDVPWQVADVSLARRVLGWHSVHDLRSSVELMTGGR